MKRSVFNYTGLFFVMVLLSTAIVCLASARDAVIYTTGFEDGIEGWSTTDNSLWEAGSLAAGPYTASAPVLSSLNINGGVTSTTKRMVTLNHTVTGTPTRYKASESPSFTGATWQAYSSQPSFTLSAGIGIKTVYFMVKNAASRSSVVQDTIELTNPLGGTWQGHWYSYYSDSGALQLIVKQAATGYKGKLTVWNTECGTLYDLPATVKLTGNTVKCVATTYCGGSAILLKYTQGTLSGNSVSGYYHVYVDGSLYDSGTFTISK